MFDKDLSHCELVRLCELVSTLSKVGSERELSEGLTQAQELLEFEAAVIGSAPVTDGRASEVQLFTLQYPVDWLESYVGGGYIELDPLIALHAAQPETRSWRSSDIEDLDRRSGRAELSEFRRCGSRFLTMGWSWKDAGPWSAYLCFSGGRTASSPRHTNVMEFLRPHIGMAVERITRKRRGDTCCARLTGREVEILRWIKDGKTNWEISMILSISERTVKFHVKNVLRKLDAVTRAHAVAVGLRLGLIEL